MTKAFFDQKRRQVRAGMKLGLRTIGRRLVSTAQKGVMNPPKSGRFYIIGGRTHQASAPGEYPAERTGRLRRSINFRMPSGTEMRFGAEAPYSPFLQQTDHPDGVASWRKIAPRPFLTNSHNENKRFMQRDLENAMWKVVK